MRSLICVAVLLLALWSCSGSAALRSRCVYDTLRKEQNKKPMAARLLPTSTNKLVSYAKEDGFSPIRITVSAHDIYDVERICLSEGEVRPDFRGGTIECNQHDLLTPRRTQLLFEEIVPEAIKLHQERLLVRRQTTPLTVPDDLFEGEICEHFTISDDDKRNGYPSTDTVIYLAAAPNHFDSGAIVPINMDTNAWASICLESPEDERPLFGALVVAPSGIEIDPYIVRFVAHEIAHVLGFDLTVIQKRGLHVTLSIPRRNVSAGFLMSNVTAKAVDEHYNCSAPYGVELHQDTPADPVESHLKRRSAKDELMSPIVGIGRYTVLTMAAFEALGYYRANWANAEYMKWGKGTGCDFLEKKCVVNGKTRYKDHFCTKPTEEEKVSYYCTSDRTALEKCAMVGHSEDLLPQFRYFENPKVGGVDFHLMEHCPIYYSSIPQSCLRKLHAMEWSVLGPNSRCFDTDRLSYKNEAISALCADVKCSDDGYEIRHQGTETFVKCPAGSSIKPSSGAGFGRGNILCPPHEEVCGFKVSFEL